MKYCESIHRLIRWKTREVRVGNVGVGGGHPIRIQSMTTSPTHDVNATVDQAVRLIEAGCEIIRVTVQGMREADACEHIKNTLVQRGYDAPLVADIHFFPKAAMRVVDFVDKVRINPGNYVDKRATFRILEYDEATYQKEIEKIEEKFTPLIEKCKQLKRAMRIGTNHGSLSDRIMNRYGDTAPGMVESALEFARICRNNDYHDIIFSMKASNPQVMIEAYRLLVAEMMKLGWDYPLHLGVTEAGEGEDGRIKSAVGIGSLLLDGLGDTIRVSLTEDPWHEIDPCKRLLRYTEKQTGCGIDFFQENHRLSKQQRTVSFPKTVAMHKNGTVLCRATPEEVSSPTFLSHLGCAGDFGHPKIQKNSADSVWVDPPPSPHSPLLLPLFQLGVGVIAANASPFTPFGRLGSHLETGAVIQVTDQDTPSLWEQIPAYSPAYLIVSPKENYIPFCRKFFEWLYEKKIKVPVILHLQSTSSKEDALIEAAMELGSLLCDGLGEGVLIDTPHGIDWNRNVAFQILQAARMRSFKTEFISCPSCGRTLFNLQEVSKKIRQRTSHLPGVKIAIMGCIVNGPGEMADADFGYVGAQPGKVDLYVGKQKLRVGIDENEAVEHLIDLIKEQGRWVEPSPSC